MILIWINVKSNRDVRFQVLTAASMKMVAFWGMVLCSLVEVDRRFRGAYCVPGYGGSISE
jgi:hypothetical protein